MDLEVEDSSGKVALGDIIAEYYVRKYYKKRMKNNLMLI